MLSLGACLVDDPSVGHYVELIPDSRETDPQAMAVHGLTLDHLEANGTPPQAAMEGFAAWLAEAVGTDAWPVFVGLNAPFDWMFVDDYFHRYLGRNPFGHSALDIKAYYMGMTGRTWSETSFAHMTTHYGLEEGLTHDALQDAQDQARLFARMLTDRRVTSTGPEG